MSEQVAEYGLIFLAYALLAAVWAAALVYIWFDADETYGTGWFWMLFVLCAPFVAIPTYWLVKRYTLRGWKAELEATERQERKQRLGLKFSGTVLDLSQELKEDVGEQERREGYTIGTVHPPKDYQPFQASLGLSERQVKERLAEWQRRRAKQKTIPPEGGPGDKVHDRLSWRSRRARTGTGGRREPPF